MSVSISFFGSMETLTGQSPPEETWVDDDYSEGNAGEHTFGADAFSTIQEGINTVDSEGTVNVATGTYEEQITINKSLTLRGSTYDINKNGYLVPENYTWNDSVESIIQPPTSSPDVDVITIDDAEDVTVEGFVIQALNRGTSGTRMLVTVKVDGKTMENLVIRNNIIGANTNVEDQDGNKGRMNLYFDVNPYDESQGLEDSLVSGNKIFDAKGNGNNIFIWASYYAYGATGPSPMDGTIIEDNEIYGSHRSGIETAGGYSDLVIRNNSIYGNRGLPTDDPNNLKYGHGILLIRGSSDKTAGPTEAYGPKDLTIQDNEIYDNEKSGIYMGPINKDYIITGNDVHDNGWDGIRIDLEGTYWNPDFEPAPSDWSCYNGTKDIVANLNKISGNERYGVRIIGTPTNDFVLDAENNHWGHATGPTSEEGSGTGNNISENIDYKPWYVDSAMTMLLDKDLQEDQTLADEADLTLENNTTEIVVPVGSPIENISIPSTVTEDKEVSLDLSLLLNPNKKVSLTKKLKLKRKGAKADYTIDIPEETTITGDSNWNGSLILPTVKNNTDYTAPSGSIEVVIDIGSESEINFSNAVKIVISGQAGKKAAWSRGTIFTDITTVCDNATNPTNIYPDKAPKECYIDEGSDLLIWTYHFTKFAAYTPASTTPTIGGSSGGGSGGRKMVSIEAPEPIEEEERKEKEEEVKEEEEEEEKEILIPQEIPVIEKPEPKVIGGKLLAVSIILFLMITLFVIESQSRTYKKTYRKLKRKIKRIFL